jgi:diguanylate cyclase (GGDEF)-like protein
MGNTPGDESEIPRLYDDILDEETKMVSTEDMEPMPTDRDRACLIVITGLMAGETFRLDEGASVIGRSSAASIRLRDDGVSRKHAEIRQEGELVRIVDLESANGTLVNGEPIREHILRDGDKVQIGSTTILKFTYHDVHDDVFQRNMLEAARRDGLTKAYSKAYFLGHLETELSFANRHRAPLSLLMMDLDHFKSINDTYGHQTGDAVLVKMAEVVMSHLRAEDVFARYGGEEFVVICRGIELERAAALAERLRVLIRATDFPGVDREVTMSIGVAQHRPEEASQELIVRADKQLYRAKNAGRNRVAHSDG